MKFILPSPSGPAKYSYLLWALDWIPQNKGKYNIVVRATDKAGNLQTAEIRDVYLNGSTGYHSVEETVS
ncbi:MAG TPA: hypothetical protein VE566_02915 [Nitrososphaeraceae archaeon]|nr:hypothetical protein [Nitrososphaeraceae archaeon]